MRNPYAIIYAEPEKSSYFLDVAAFLPLQYFRNLGRLCQLPILCANVSHDLNLCCSPFRLLSGYGGSSLFYTRKSAVDTLNVFKNETSHATQLKPRHLLVVISGVRFSDSDVIDKHVDS